eukprot:6192784-Pleurochrysis_carterae.AAC.1
MSQDTGTAVLAPRHRGGKLARRSVRVACVALVRLTTVLYKLAQLHGILGTCSRYHFMKLGARGGSARAPAAARS